MQIRRVTPRKQCQPRNPNKSWWNLECYQARCKKEMALQKARRTGEFQEYRATRKSYKDLINERKRGSQQLILDQLAQIDNMGDA